MKTKLNKPHGVLVGVFVPPKDDFELEQRIKKLKANNLDDLARHLFDKYCIKKSNPQIDEKSMILRIDDKDANIAIDLLNSVETVDVIPYYIGEPISDEENELFDNIDNSETDESFLLKMDDDVSFGPDPRVFIKRDKDFYAKYALSFYSYISELLEVIDETECFYDYITTIEHITDRRIYKNDPIVYRFIDIKNPDKLKNYMTEESWHKLLEMGTIIDE